MGMFYCHGCDSYHDSKDGEYNLTLDGKEYCDATLPEGAQIECSNPAWHQVFGKLSLRPVTTNPATKSVTAVRCGESVQFIEQGEA